MAGHFSLGLTKEGYMYNNYNNYYRMCKFVVVPRPVDVSIYIALTITLTVGKISFF